MNEAKTVGVERLIVLRGSGGFGRTSFSVPRFVALFSKHSADGSAFIVPWGLPAIKFPAGEREHYSTELSWQTPVYLLYAQSVWG